MKSIPTYYQGRLYRSRLEARYACFFDKLGWPHEYEPLDLAGRTAYTRMRACGYIPDFALRFPVATVLVECKPFTLPFPEEALDVCARIADAWEGNALLVGANHIVTEDESTDPDIRIDEDGLFPIVHHSKAHGLSIGGTIEIGRVRRAGKRNAWQSAYLDFDEAGHWIVQDEPRHLEPHPYMQARMAWADAGNATQWNPPVVPKRTRGTW